MDSQNTVYNDRQTGNADIVIIRDETEADISKISEITAEAFKSLEISDNTEQFIIAALRKARALTISLIAEIDGHVVGHIAFSPVTISDGTQGWFGLGPVSVLPKHQRQGIGKALIHEGIARLKNMNAKGCCLIGHPDYYKKLGFKNTGELGFEAAPAEAFFVMSFDGNIPRGKVAFHEAFMAQS